VDNSNPVICEHCDHFNRVVGSFCGACGSRLFIRSKTPLKSSQPTSPESQYRRSLDDDELDTETDSRPQATNERGGCIIGFLGLITVLLFVGLIGNTIGNNSEDDALAGRESTQESTSTPTIDDIKAAHRTDVDVRDLDRDPLRFRGELLYFEGEVINFVAHSSGFFSSEREVTAQIRVTSSGESGFRATVVAIRTDQDSVNGIYQGDSIRVWGTANGTLEGTNLLGGRISQPRIDAGFIEKAP
jgi:hypothetical protein